MLYCYDICDLVYILFCKMTVPFFLVLFDNAQCRVFDEHSAVAKSSAEHWPPSRPLDKGEVSREPLSCG